MAAGYNKNRGRGWRSWEVGLVLGAWGVQAGLYWLMGTPVSAVAATEVPRRAAIRSFSDMTMAERDQFRAAVAAAQAEVKKTDGSRQ